ncbi:MAG: hypothetical protein HKO56_03495, partial [Bacteroidia bacterium]|nr:hypothetical protein [Bacteroidia bacterium]
MRKIYTPLQGVMLTLSLIFLVSEFTFAHSNLSKNAASVATSADIILVASGTTTLCQGNSVDLSVSGTYASYQWSTGESTASITVNSAGSYFLSATDSSSNVLFSDTVIVSVGSPATVNAGMDGIVCANNEWSMGGMAPGASIGGSASSAMWLGGTTSSFLDGRSDLDGGYMADTSEYGTTITFVLMTNDPGNGCPAASDTALVEFQNFPDLLPIPDQFNTCPFSVFNLASIPVVDANNAIGVYAYQDASNQPLASSVVTTSGTYYIVKATMTTPSCFDFEPVNVTIGNCTCALVLSKTQVNATCPGASDGSIDFSVSGGTAPYSYIWTTGDTTQDLNNIPAGLYSVVVTDAFFCMDTINVTITEQSALSATCSELTQASCPGVSDGTALILATGGSGSSSFQWYDSNANNLSVNSAVLSSVSPGIYQAIVTDGLNCMDTCSIEITSTGTTDTTLLSATTCDTALVGATQQTLQNQAGCDSVVITNTTLLPGDTVNLTATTCDTALVGITQQTFQNQVGCDSVVITNTTLLPSNTVNLTATTCDTALVGISQITLQNQAGCDSIVITTTALDSNCTIILNCNISSTNVTCFGGNDGTATGSALNGTAPFSYSWSNGGTTATINNLTAGSYSLIITDAVGSTGSCTVTISEPGELSISCSVLQNVTCAGGSDGALDFIISGGTQPYGVSVVGSGGIPVNINGIVSGGLLANTYTVTVTDSSGCTDTCMVTISEPDSLIATCVIDQEILCNGQHATASASAVGGTGSYSYLWSNGSTTATNDSLLGGTYTITITDSLGCTSECMVVIVEPAPLTVACSIDQEISCAGANDGAASVIATGGTAPYTYSWSNGMTTASISSLSPNTYTVIVLDSNGCVNTCSVIINDAAPLAPIVAGSNSPLCDNNLLMLSASGTYSSYAWVGPNTFSSAMQNPSFVGGVAASGMYTVTATDTNGCSTSDSILVTINACFNLGDQTWVDINQDGLFNGSDTALAGVLVTLHDSAGAVIGTATTDSTGNYLFTDLL